MTAVAERPVGLHPARLKVEGLHVQFGGVHALNGVTFEAEPGSIVGLIGANQTIQFITSGLGLILFILYLPGGLAELLHRSGDAVTLGIRSVQERLSSRRAGPPVTPTLIADGAEQ